MGINPDDFRIMQERCDKSRGKLRRQDNIVGEVDRAGASNEEQQDDCQRPINHKPKKAKVDGKVHRSFRVSITLRYSDQRERDIDGAASTILDCIQHACKRLQAMDTSIIRRGS